MMQFGAEKKDETKRSEAEIFAIWVPYCLL